MRNAKQVKKAALAAMLVASCVAVQAQSTVGYGRITAVRTVDVASQTAPTTGALLGGTIGLVSGRNQSSSNQALRAGTGAFAGSRIARSNSGTTAFEYTILQGGRTVTMVTSETGLRVGDCVSVEQGAYNNLRLVDDARCAPAPASTPRPAPGTAAAPALAAAPASAPASAVREANACVSAKEALLAAETDETFDRAERRVRLLCAD